MRSHGGYIDIVQLARTPAVSTDSGIYLKVYITTEAEDFSVTPCTAFHGPSSHGANLLAGVNI